MLKTCAKFLASRLELWPLTRSLWSGEHSDRTTIPCQFVLADVLSDSYWVRLYGLPATAYVKEAIYAGKEACFRTAGTGNGDRGCVYPYCTGE
jgi:hypothetical protein